MAKSGNRLWLKVLIGLGLGVVVGALLGPELGLVSREAAKTAASWLALPGNLFIDLIRFIVIPLVISSVALGVAGSGNIKLVRKLGLAILGFFLTMIMVSASIGISVTSVLQPGAFFDRTTMADAGDVAAQVPSPAGMAEDIPATIVDLVPTNPIAAMAEGDMLAIIIAAGIFGAALLVMKAGESTPLIRLLDSVQGACLTIINFLMKFAPLAVFGLLAKVMITNGFGALLGLGAYVGTFLLILALILAVYAVIVSLLGRNPLEFAKNIREPFLLAFSTSSSSATMPVTLQTAETKLGIHPTVSRMVIPLGTTINMDGTAAYQSCVVVFLAQVFGIDLSAGQIVTLVMLSIAGSVGAPGMPGGILAILVGVLSEFGIPPEGFAIILAVDRILDMARTTVNVTGDLVTSAFVQKISGLGSHAPLKKTS
ncbi:MAG TPA: dicarboxylate/amino acid:cation symporter [Sphingomonadales bacterium]|nr:dicarboxylate/amino acid:cation symporter [Sphingomonadales bacterium]